MVVPSGNLILPNKKFYSPFEILTSNLNQQRFLLTAFSYPQLTIIWSIAFSTTDLKSFLSVQEIQWIHYDTILNLCGATQSLK